MSRNYRGLSWTTWVLRNLKWWSKKLEMRGWLITLIFYLNRQTLKCSWEIKFFIFLNWFCIIKIIIKELPASIEFLMDAIHTCKYHFFRQPNCIEKQVRMNKKQQKFLNHLLRLEPESTGEILKEQL